MRRLRILLTLLLCLGVPLAGWASTMTAAGCVEQAHQHDKLASATGGHHHHDDCAGEPAAGHPCKGDPCGCGCGFGACTSGAFLEVASMPRLDFLARSTSLLNPQEAAFASARSATLLRPPIA